jgi:hypothetical protein
VQEDAFIPKEFSNIDNLDHITAEEFKKSFNIS